MRNIFLNGILAIGTLLCLGVSSAAQTPCTAVRGQITCPPPQESKAKPSSCAEGGPLIIKLNQAGTFYERSVGYSNLDDNLKCRGSNVGFFGAASDVTWSFSVDENFIKRFTGGFPDVSDKFLSLASNQLVALNTAEFQEIRETGVLRTLDGRGYFSNGVDIDGELVRREQAVVENGLFQTGPYRNQIVGGINARVQWNLDNARYVEPSATMQAIAQVRDNLRTMYPNAQYDYGNIYHRIAVGNILAARHRQ